MQIERHCGGLRRTVDLTLHLHAATVHIDPNKDLSPARHKTQPLSLVVATEVAALRWCIERLHFTLKSGALEVEKLQFDDVHTLANALAFYSVVAWQLLGLTYALRHDPEQPAETMFDSDKLTLLHQLLGKPVDSLRRATLALVKLVGFAPSKKQPWPGVKVLTTAIERFFFVQQGAAAVSKPLQG